MNIIRNAQNPMSMVQSLASNNPQLQSVMNLINNSNKSPKDLFYEKANEMGVDPDEFIRQLQQI